MNGSQMRAVALGIGQGVSDRAAVTSIPDQGRHGRVLRIALALRGGVSLAVWIGGAIAELDVARRIRIAETPDGWDAYYVTPSEDESPDLDGPEISRATVYARHLDAAGYDAIQFDVLAGASAGGLNAVVYGVAQRAGASINSLLDAWQEAADVRHLLQPPGFRTADSLMRGDYYFWPRVESALHALHSEPGIGRNPLHVSSTISVDLAATIIDSTSRSVPGSYDTRGYFHFVADSASPAAEVGRRIPAQVGDGSDLSRLAYAARSTSSFPGAFEPALIFSKTKRVGESVTGDSRHIDMSFVFSGHRPDWNHPFRVIDGSILDDVPIDQAFRAVRRSASATRSDRVLLYLDPSPPAPPPNTVRPTRYGPSPAEGPVGALRRFKDRQSRVLNVLRAGRHASDDGDPGGPEVARVERFRLELLRDAARGRAFAASSERTAFAPERGRIAYTRYRAARDARYLTAVTADPSHWQASATLATRSTWLPWEQDSRERLAGALQARFDRAADDADATARESICAGPQGLYDAALCALAWVRDLERLADHDAARAAAELRLRIYRVLAQASDARDAVTASVLTAAHGAADPANAAAAEWVTASGAHELSPLWRALDVVVGDARAVSSAVAEVPDWRNSPFSGAPSQDNAFTARDLPSFLAPRGIPDALSSISFERLTAAEPPAHADQYAPLVRRRRSARTGLALSLDRRDVTDETVTRLYGTDTLSAEDKLSGSLLWNFGGFLSAAWRSNDWWWGRLDASASLVRMLTRRTDAGSQDASESDVDDVQAALLTELASSDNAPLSGEASATSVEEIRRRFEFGADTLENLAPAYRLAVASRVVRVASRAIAGSVGRPTRILIGLLRPFAVALPLAMAPLRAAVVAAIIGIAVAVIGGVAPPRGVTELPVTWPAHLISCALISIAVIVVCDSAARWRHLLKRLRHVAVPLSEATVADVSGLRRRAMAQATLFAALSVMTSAAASALVLARGLDVTWWLLSTLSAGCIGVARTRALTPSSLSQSRLGWLTAPAVYLVFASTIAAIPSVLAPIHLQHRIVTPLTVAVACAAVALILTGGWLRFGPTLRGVIANPLTVSLIASAAGTLPVWLATQLADTPFPALTTLTTVVAGILAWGTAVWWLPEFPGDAHDIDAADDARHPAAV